MNDPPAVLSVQLCVNSVTCRAVGDSPSHERGPSHSCQKTCGKKIKTPHEKSLPANRQTFKLSNDEIQTEIGTYKRDASTIYTLSFILRKTVICTSLLFGFGLSYIPWDAGGFWSALGRMCSSVQLFCARHELAIPHHHSTSCGEGNKNIGGSY